MAKIGKDVFNGCDALISIEIPKSVTEIAQDIFMECNALRTVKVSEDADVSNWGLGKGVQIIYY